MNVVNKTIEVFAAGKNGGQMVDIQAYVTDEQIAAVERLVMEVTEDQAVETLATVIPKLFDFIMAQGVEIFREADEMNLGYVLEKFMNELDENPAAKIPSEIKGGLRKKIGAWCQTLRTAKDNPVELVKGDLVHTSEGYVLNLWILDQSLSLYSGFATPFVAQTEAVEVVQEEPAIEAVEEVQPQLVEPIAEPVEVILIHPSEKPIILPRVETIVPPKRSLTPREVSTAFANSGRMRFF